MHNWAPLQRQYHYRSWLVDDVTPEIAIPDPSAIFISCDFRCALFFTLSLFIMDPASYPSFQKLSLVLLFVLIRVNFPFRTFYTLILWVCVGRKSGGRSSSSHFDFLLYFPFSLLFHFSTPFNLILGLHFPFSWPYTWGLHPLPPFSF